MAKGVGFLFLFILPSTGVMAKWQFQASFSCSNCVMSGMMPFNIKGEIKGESVIPVGYEYFQGIGHYKFYPEGAMSYNQALATCKNDGAHLAIINSQAEQEVLKKIYARHPKAKEWAYLGFNDFEEDGKYVTMFGQPLSDTGFIKWAPGQPDNAEGNEDCGSVHRTGGLNDLWCDKHVPWPFFCEYEDEGSRCH